MKKIITKKTAEKLIKKGQCKFEGYAGDYGILTDYKYQATRHFLK